MDYNIAQWKSEYESGNQLVDEQHKFLFSLINTLHNAMLTGQAQTVVEHIFSSFYNHLVVHISTEEVYMQEHNYPYYLEHLEKHEELKKRLIELKTQGVVTLSRFLTDWLINHIQQDDLKMVEFCNLR
jgi:hemerythrin